ncbi:LasA protease [Burkholderia sp. Bp9126]|nr:LasA protease [Burkholderia sp. Bp9126]
MNCSIWSSTSIWARRFLGLQLICAFLTGFAYASIADNTLQRAVEQEFAHSLGDQEKSSQSNGNVVEMVKSDDVAGWGFGTITRTVAESESGDPVTKFFLARRAGDKWVAGIEGSRVFDALLGAVPPTLLSVDERRHFAVKPARYASKLGAITQPGLALPWRQNAGWYWTGGAHGWSGNSRPYNSLDFSGGDGRVLAPRDGYLYKSCERNGSAIVKLVHDNGYTTTYYHMVQLTSLNNGAHVRQGEYLGHIGNGLPCGGHTTGPHVHFSLSEGGNDIPMDGVTIGGWKFFQGPNPYSGYAVRNQRRVSPQAWLVNYGGDDAGDPDEPSTPFTARVQAPGDVNLRSAPSLAASIVGVVANGRAVQLICHAYGDSVNGNWGRTRLWYRLDSNQWVSDGFIHTGSNGPVVSACAG